MITFECELYCAECGCKLESEKGVQPTNIPYFEVTPCPDCIQSAYDDGHSDGYCEGCAAAEEAAYYREN